ncbi:5235_t:CDS:1, partial [Racocetra persica]
PRITGREVVIVENSRLQIRIYELEQRIRALNLDKDELIRDNTHLRNRVEELVQIHAANENLTRLNNVLKIVLRDCEDERDHYK